MYEGEGGSTEVFLNNVDDFNELKKNLIHPKFRYAKKNAHDILLGCKKSLVEAKQGAELIGKRRNAEIWIKSLSNSTEESSRSSFLQNLNKKISDEGDNGFVDEIFDLCLAALKEDCATYVNVGDVVSKAAVLEAGGRCAKDAALKENTFDVRAAIKMLNSIEDKNKKRLDGHSVEKIEKAKVVCNDEQNELNFCGLPPLIDKEGIPFWFPRTRDESVAIKHKICAKDDGKEEEEEDSAAQGIQAESISEDFSFSEEGELFDNEGMQVSRSFEETKVAAVKARGKLCYPPEIRILKKIIRNVRRTDNEELNVSKYVDYMRFKAAQESRRDEPPYLKNSKTASSGGVEETGDSSEEQKKAVSCQQQFFLKETESNQQKAKKRERNLAAGLAFLGFHSQLKNIYKLSCNFLNFRENACNNFKDLLLDYSFENCSRMNMYEKVKNLFMLISYEIPNFFSVFPHENDDHCPLQNKKNKNKTLLHFTQWLDYQINFNYTKSHENLHNAYLPSDFDLTDPSSFEDDVKVQLLDSDILTLNICNLSEVHNYCRDLNFSLSSNCSELLFWFRIVKMNLFPLKYNRRWKKFRKRRIQKNVNLKWCGSIRDYICRAKEDGKGKREGEDGKGECGLDANAEADDLVFAGVPSYVNSWSPSKMKESNVGFAEETTKEEKEIEQASKTLRFLSRMSEGEKEMIAQMDEDSSESEAEKKERLSEEEMLEKLRLNRAEGVSRAEGVNRAEGSIRRNSSPRDFAKPNRKSPKYLEVLLGDRNYLEAAISYVGYGMQSFSDVINVKPKKRRLEKYLDLPAACVNSETCVENSSSPKVEKSCLKTVGEQKEGRGNVKGEDKKSDGSIYLPYTVELSSSENSEANCNSANRQVRLWRRNLMRNAEEALRGIRGMKTSNDKMNLTETSQEDISCSLYENKIDECFGHPLESLARRAKCSLPHLLNFINSENKQTFLTKKLHHAADEKRDAKKTTRTIAKQEKQSNPFLDLENCLSRKETKRPKVMKDEAIKSFKKVFRKPRIRSIEKHCFSDHHTSKRKHDRKSALHHTNDESSRRPSTNRSLFTSPDSISPKNATKCQRSKPIDVFGFFGEAINHIGREIRIIGFYENKFYNHFYKNKIYRNKLNGYEQTLKRREYLIEIDDIQNTIKIYPVEETSLYITDTPRQKRNDYYLQSIVDGSHSIDRFVFNVRKKIDAYEKADVGEGNAEEESECKVLDTRGKRAGKGGGGGGIFVWKDELGNLKKVNDDLLANCVWVLYENLNLSINNNYNFAEMQNLQEESECEFRGKNEISTCGQSTSEAHRADNRNKTASKIDEKYLIKSFFRYFYELKKSAFNFQVQQMCKSHNIIRWCKPNNYLMNYLSKHFEQLLYRYIYEIYPFFVSKYLNIREAFYIQQKEESGYIKNLNQLNDGSKGELIDTETLKTQIEKYVNDENVKERTLQLKKQKEDIRLTIYEQKYKFIQNALPKFNLNASIPEEIFQLHDVIPYTLLEDDSMDGLPYLKWLEQKETPSNTNKNIHTSTSVKLCKSLMDSKKNKNLQELKKLANLLIILNWLIQFFPLHYKNFNSPQHVMKVFNGRYENAQAADIMNLSFDEKNKQNIFSAKCDNIDFFIFLVQTFMKKDEENKFFIPEEGECKLMCSILWLCLYISETWSFDFSVMIQEDWCGNFLSKFKHCSDLMNLKNKTSNLPFLLNLECPFTLKINEDDDNFSFKNRGVLNVLQLDKIKARAKRRNEARKERSWGVDAIKTKKQRN